MSGTAAEYIGRDEHRPPFRLVETGPDIGQLILQARDEVVENVSISHGAARMFVRILDLSVRQSSKGIEQPPGVVTISQMKLSEKFNVSLRTVWNWKWELIKAGAIWMTCQPMPNAWPIDTYHVSKLHPPKHSGDKTTAEGLWGNGARRQRPEQIGLGAREPGQRQIPGTGARSNGLRVATGFQDGEKSSISPAIATASRNELQASAETDFGGEPQETSAGSRNEFRRGAEASCDGEPKPVAAGNRNGLRRATETSCEHIRARRQESASIEGGKASPPPDKAFEDWVKHHVKGAFTSKLLALERKIKARIETARSAEAKAGLRRQLKAVQDEMLPPVPDTPTPTVASVGTPKAPAMPLSEAKARWEKAKAEAGLAAPKNLPAGMTQPANRKEESNDENNAKRPARRQAKPARV